MQKSMNFIKELSWGIAAGSPSIEDLLRELLAFYRLTASIPLISLFPICLLFCLYDTFLRLVLHLVANPDLSSLDWMSLEQSIQCLPESKVRGRICPLLLVNLLAMVVSNIYPIPACTAAYAVPALILDVALSKVVEDRLSSSIPDYPDAYAGWNALTNFGSYISVVGICHFFVVVTITSSSGKNKRCAPSRWAIE
ncbi:hypothetical protein T459_04758 [Capsicum annuum]|uniref:Uncharacterized protein n=1 Tax=Capsicum annuum TaxID=4072 RepID=A0A2G3A5X5_CAPAN|nr:hypothetical protein T459_04758 [Capsicum annuum]